MAQLPGGNVVADEEPTVHNERPELESGFKPRSYQLEMLEESMRRNIIVAVRLPLFLYSSMANRLRWTLDQERPLCIYIYAFA